MLTIEKALILKTISIFSNTSEEALADIASILEEVEVAAGETIFNKGDFGNSMYIIISGQVRVHDGSKTITHLGDREIFGELAILDPEPRNASVTAVKDSVLFRLEKDALFELMADHMDIVSGIFHVLCTRLRKITVQAMERR